MSDVESVDNDVGVEEEEEEVKDLISSVRKVLKTACIHDGVVKGLHEVTKAISSKRALICFLSEGCEEPPYKKLVQALCKEQSVPLVDVPDSKNLGQWCGLCSYDAEKKARKIVGASCVAITDYGEQSDALNFLQNHIRTQS